MNSNLSFIPKESQELPDYYGLKITLLTGKILDIKIASHRIIDKVLSANSNGQSYVVGPLATPYIEYVTHDDFWGNIPISAILLIEFDKNFSKIIAYREKKYKEELAKTGVK